MGEQNAVNLYKEDTSTQQLEAYAKERGLAVVSFDSIIPVPVGENSALNWMINPRASSGERMPLVFYLKPGERITHMAVKLPQSEVKNPTLSNSKQNA